ncbi:hypothetical protein HDV00_001094 [Rhizophlyctis rosea]|nr:hypothetical protein HDV00_001094 [Rhizophlyctis rosea]
MYATNFRPVYLAVCLHLLVTILFSPSTWAQTPKSEYRNVTGQGNNLMNGNWGAAMQPYTFGSLPFVNWYTPQQPQGTMNARNVSTLLQAIPTEPSPRNLTDFVTYWAEFITMDITRTFRSPANVSVPIPVPPGDKSFSAIGAANASIPMYRVSTPNDTTASGPLKINQATAWLDASMIYGADSTHRDAIRAPGGLLKLGGNGLPVTQGEDVNFRNLTVWVNSGTPGPSLFTFGTVNGNTHPILQSLFILFMREHNRRVAQLKKSNSALTDDQLYELARVHVIALIQQITYYEYLPIVFGINPLSIYKGYNQSADPTVDTFFETVSFRYGHSEVNPYQLFVNLEGQRSTYALHDIFFNNDLVRKLGIEGFLTGAATAIQQKPACSVVDDLRNVLFGNKVMDLFALDIERSRDFGVPTYNDVREKFGRPRAKTWDDVTTNPKYKAQLQLTYGNVDALDAIVGGQLEDRSDGTNLGPLFRDNIADMFRRLRDGDRFWFENVGGPGSPDNLDEIKNTTLRDVIVRNAMDNMLGPLPSNLWASIPPLSSLPAPSTSIKYHVELVPDILRLSFQIEDPDHVRLLIECTALQWCGIGFGTGMQNGDFIVIRADDSGKMSVNEYSSQGRGVQPSPRSAGESLLNVVSANKAGGVMSVEVIRKNSATGAANNGRNYVATNGYTGMFYAFHPGPRVSDPTGGLGWFLFHGLSNCGTNEINFSTGASNVLSTGSNSSRRDSHGLGMGIVWGVIFPFAVFYSRFLRHTKGWLWVHITLQIIGSLIVLFMAGWILSDPASDMNAPNVPQHAYLGFVLVACVIVQLLLGRFMIVAGFVQIGLGVNVIYPMLTGAGGPGVGPSHPIWIGYLLGVVGWVIIFVAAECFFVYRVRAGLKQTESPSIPRSRSTISVKRASRRNDSQSSRTEMLAITRNDSEKDASRNGSLNSIRHSLTAKRTSTKSVKGIMSLKFDLEEGARKPLMTWREVGERILAGEMLVVGNGRYVYDIAPWAPHHPGGRLVLNAVIGTDITVDFFNEADFDGTAYTPGKVIKKKNTEVPRSQAQAAAAARMLHRQNGDIARRGSGGSNREAPPYGMFDKRPGSSLSNGEEEDVTAGTPQLNLSEAEWNAVRKSRMTHRHGRFAVQKLVTFMIGELEDESGIPIALSDMAGVVNPGGPNGMNIHGGAGNSNLRAFNRYEFRRYALVHKVQANSKDALVPVFRMRFALVYPFHALRRNEPTRFLPGQCIEIVDRLVGHGLVPRYYTPISGSPACFDVLVKCYPDGLMGTNLMKRKPGDRQFKIRGPFGTPLLVPEKPISMKISDSLVYGLGGYYQTLVLVGAGAGISPCLQFIREYFLPIGRTVVANEEYLPEQADELPLVPGDKISVLHESGDGWAYGINRATHDEGSFPLSLVTPPPGLHVRVLLINCVRSQGDITGTDILSPALRAYPSLLQIHHFVSRRPSHPVANPPPGEISYGRLTPHILEDMVAPLWRDTAHVPARRVVVCGPSVLESMVFDTLIDTCGVDAEDIFVLPPNSYYSTEKGRSG